MKIAAVVRLIISCVLILCVTTPVLAQLDTALFSGMKARSIGPAGMSGRIASIAAVNSAPEVMYVGAATGGVWKSTNGGVSWKPIFDDQSVNSIGAVAVYQPNPAIVWVGTGEGNPRNSAGVGNGMYKSLDGGETWAFLGLDRSERINRVVLHPSDPSVAYAAAMGSMWGENPDRGVFKTNDGGKSWKKVLYVNEKTGCAELVMDPSNPNKLFAAMWEYRRWPWFFKSGGLGSGLYVTYDGGDTWKQITEKDGLPKGELGRVGISVARNNPSVVYALVEAKKSALCRSEDGGRTWRIVNQTTNIANRPFYYTEIYTDPQNENRLYSLYSELVVSNDGGKSFTNLTPGNRVHSDHHALWIQPDDGNFLIDGNDGGVYISHDRGRTWRFVDNIPSAQFYHISVDNEIPYNLYGGMQDNGSWRGPSDVWENSGIRNFHWKEVGFGDGFATLVDASDANYGYSMSQGGALIRYHLTTGERKNIRPWAPDGVELRFNWNAGIAQDPFETKTIYYGSQFLHKSTDRGDSWTIISPDLTTNDPQKQKQDESGGLTPDVTAAENHTTILTIAPSPVRPGVIWVGTDDGNVQITQDGGKTWTNVADRIPDVPKNTWVPHLEASKFDAGSAYVVFDNHRRMDLKTYVYKTDNFGKSWSSLTKNDPVSGSNKMWGYALTIVQDPVKKELLYLGTEFGLFISNDDGKYWMKFSNGFPTASTMALLVHPRDNDLVIGTHGRAAYILDDIRPLRALNKEVFDETLHIFEIPSTYAHRIKQMDGYHFPGDALFRGESKPYGAMITYSVNPSKMGGRDMGGEGERSEIETEVPETQISRDSVRAKIEVLDAQGSVIRKTDGPAKRGINRITWNLRRDGFKQPRITAPTETGREFTPQGPEVLPGKYTVRIKLGKSEVTQSVDVLQDPRTMVPIEVRKQKFDLMMLVGQKTEVVAEAVDRIQKTKKAIDIVLDQLKERKDSTARDIRRSGEALKKSLTTLSNKFIPPSDRQGTFRGDDNVTGKLRSVAGSLSSSYDAPTEAQLKYWKQAQQYMEDALKEFNRVFAENVAGFKKKVETTSFTLFPASEPLDSNWKKSEK
jgi:photosystem II stability/assembly factor-like uncharacterized protein